MTVDVALVHRSTAVINRELWFKKAPLLIGRNLTLECLHNMI